MIKQNLFKVLLNCIIILFLTPACSLNLEDCDSFTATSFPNIFDENQLIAHSHNDYEQNCPLIKAIALGYKSIEVDIFPFEQTIRVSHDDVGLDTQPTIQAMYLNPLRNRIDDIEQEIELLVDLKFYSPDFLQLLHQTLEEYDDMLTRRNSQSKQIKIILSGDIPREELIQNPEWVYFFIDGRLGDLEKNIDSHLMPLISTNFMEIVEFRPSQILSTTEIEQLENYINLTHSEGKKIRFWKTADNSIIWAQLIDLEVDVIGVDDLDSFYEYISDN